MIITYPVGQLFDDTGALLSAPVVTIATVTDKTGGAIATPGATVNGSGTANPISVDYDSEAHGEAWITLAVSQAGRTVTGSNAQIWLYCARDSSRLASMLSFPQAIVQAAPAPTTTSVAVTGLAATGANAYQKAFALFTTGGLAYTTAFAVASSSYAAGVTTLVFTGLATAPAAGDLLILLGSKN